MSLERQYAHHRDATVLTLTGHLGGEATARFVGAIDRVRPRATGPVPLRVHPDLDTALDTLASQG